jgi:hypothetical protein
VRLLYSFSHYYKFTTQIHKERGTSFFREKYENCLNKNNGLNAADLQHDLGQVRG